RSVSAPSRPGNPTPFAPPPCPAAGCDRGPDVPIVTPITRTVFVHGRGRSGPEAWPVQAAEDDPDDVFLRRTDRADQPERDADRVIEALGGRGHVVAHSYGTVTA